MEKYNMSTREDVKKDVKKDNNTKERKKVEIAPPKQYRVVLDNNMTTAHEAVMDVLTTVFEHQHQRAYQIMVRAESAGYAICYIHNKEICETKKLEAERYCLTKAGERGHGAGGYKNYEDLVFRVEEHED